MKPLAELRRDAQLIFQAGLRGADAAALIKRKVRVSGNLLHVAGGTYDLAAMRRILVAGCGKAAAPMARALEEILGSRITGGVVIVKYGHALRLDRIEVIQAGHPIPDQAGVDGARQILKLASEAEAGDLILFVVSGGGSALLPLPVAGLSLLDKQKTTQALLASGATIQEVNAVRRHLSRLKGGRLAELAQPAGLAALILSDVVGDDLDAIASGPTVPDTSSYADCLRMLRAYGLVDKIPQSVLELFERGARGEIAETPKPTEPFFRDVHNVIIGTNESALSAAKAHAEALGYRTRVLSSTMTGESRIVASSHAALLKAVARQKNPAEPPQCLISGGETTVTVRGDGLGGRNQEFALAAAIEIGATSNVVVLSGASDGSDGPTDAAGAIIDGTTVTRGQELGLDAAEFLARNDSYRFFCATGDLLVIGPTLTNVMDVQVSLIA